MPQRQIHSNSSNDEELETFPRARDLSRDNDSDSGHGSEYDDVLEDIDTILEDAVIVKLFVQQGGE